MPRVLQDWTCSTVRFCLTYESCYSISYCQTGMFQPGELKRLVLAFTDPLTPLIYLFPTCHSSSHLHSSLSAQKQARSHTFATPPGLLLYGRQRDMTGSVAAGKEREGRNEEKKKRQVQLCQPQGLEFWNFIILIVFPARKAVPHLWGKASGQAAARWSVPS